jgi:hypothetical protein
MEANGNLLLGFWAPTLRWMAIASSACDLASVWETFDFDTPASPDRTPWQRAQKMDGEQRRA